MQKNIFILIAISLLLGCSITNEKLYEGKLKSNNEHAIISTISFYDTKNLNVKILKIDGIPINIGTAASLLVLPGTHTIETHMKTFPGYTGGVFEESWMEGTTTLTLLTAAGHTYIPYSEIDGKFAKVRFDDKGLNFPEECLPVWVFVNTSKNSAMRLHDNGKVCKI